MSEPCGLSTVSCERERVEADPKFDYLPDVIMTHYRMFPSIFDTNRCHYLELTDYNGLTCN